MAEPMESNQPTARIQLTLPLDRSEVAKLRSGDLVSLSGPVFTARDAAHRRLVEALDRGEAPPFPLQGQTIYYVGPCPAPPGRPVGSAGPTTSGRMDRYAPRLLRLGLLGMIGKGKRTEEVRQCIVETGAVYFGATGGAGALIAQCVESAEVVAYEDLGTEAVRRLVVRDFPAVVLIDPTGEDLYRIGRERYRRNP
jgi:fumarate hydratase subunit beta